MEESQISQSDEPIRLKPGQTPIDIWPNWVDENTIVLTQDDIDHIPDIFQLFRLVNNYKKTPVYQLKEGEDYHVLNHEKTGDLQVDMSRDKFDDIGPAYHKVKPYISRFIYYYGRHIEPVKFDYNPDWPGQRTPYGHIIYNIVGYRNLEQFVPNYERIRDYVLKALDWYYRNDVSLGDITTILGRKISDLTGNQYLMLLREDRRRIEYERQIKSLF